MEKGLEAGTNRNIVIRQLGQVIQARDSGGLGYKCGRPDGEKQTHSRSALQAESMGLTVFLNLEAGGELLSGEGG